MPRPLTPSDTVRIYGSFDQNTDRFIRKRVRAKEHVSRSNARRRVYSATAFPVGEILPAFPSRFRRQHLAHVGLGDPELSRYAGRCDSRLEGCSHSLTWPRVN